MGKDGYTKNNLIKNGAKVEYKKEDLSQVNPQLYERLAIVNDKSSNNILPQDTEKSNENVDYSLSETDNEYLSAVESGDTETAQKMVDEAAKENGYTIKAYHGTGQFGFTEFDPAMSDDKTTLLFIDDIMLLFFVIMFYKTIFQSGNA